MLKKTGNSPTVHKVRDLFHMQSLITLEWSAVEVSVTHVHLKLILTLAVKLNGVTVRLAEAPWTVEDGSALFNVDLLRFGLGSSDHHTGTAERAKKSEELRISHCTLTQPQDIN